MPHKATRALVFVATAGAWLSAVLVGGCIDVDGFFPHPPGFGRDVPDAVRQDASRGDTAARDASTSDARPVDAASEDRRDVKPDEPPIDAFNVTGAVATSATRLAVTFAAPPNPAQALALTSYEVPGLTLAGPPVLDGNVVTFSTSAQSATTYTLTVSGVTRATDSEPLFLTSATFQGRPPFDVVEAKPQSAIYVTVRFDAAPNVAEATSLASYEVPGLTLKTAVMLADDTVLLRTSPQQTQPYSVKVDGVTRASDGEPLTNASASFTGKSGFNVLAAESKGNQSMTVTFDAPPNRTEALNAENYYVSGLALSAPVLSGNVVTLVTTPQTARSYELTVFDVTRASDGEGLSNTDVTFEGTP